jgi:hypothetical protein
MVLIFTNVMGKIGAAELKFIGTCAPEGERDFAARRLCEFVILERRRSHITFERVERPRIGRYVSAFIYVPASASGRPDRPSSLCPESGVEGFRRVTPRRNFPRRARLKQTDELQDVAQLSFDRHEE